MRICVHGIPGISEDSQDKLAMHYFRRLRVDFQIKISGRQLKKLKRPWSLLQNLYLSINSAAEEEAGAAEVGAV